MIVVGVTIYHIEKFLEATSMSHRSHGGVEQHENVGVLTESAVRRKLCFVKNN